MGDAKPLWSALGAFVAMGALALLLGGCLEADTLGGEAFDEVAVGTPPTWNSGVGELMQLKCGVCHVVPANSVSPEFIPGDLDLNVQNAPSPGVRGAADILGFLAAGVLQPNGGNSGAPRMPLPYATPLTTAEITALEAWDGS